MRFVRLMLASFALVVFSLPAGAGELRAGLSVQSKALAGPLAYSLYLPEGYKGSSRRYPVVYLLHGYGANEREWASKGDIAAILDDMIAKSELPPVIAIMPYGAKSWYVDSAEFGGPGDYETAIMRDLIGHIDASYRTMKDRGGRAIAGLSMGGFGALRLAFFHPGKFAATASLSGSLYNEVGIPGVERPVEAALTEAEKWFRGAFGQPFDPYIYQLRNPFSKVQSLTLMKDPPKVMITVGDDDYFKFHYGSLALFTEMRRARLPVELRVDDGGHDWALWRKQIRQVLSFFGEVFPRY